MTWLVTGGAGYIGAHVVRAFTEAGIASVVIDNLSSGHREFVPADIPFVRGSVTDAEVLGGLFAQYAIEGVVHLAGYKYASESVKFPLLAYEHNVTGTALLLAAMTDAGVGRIVFSSSSAVYGNADVAMVTESTETRPVSPYGESKLVAEWLIRNQGLAQGLVHTSLRYFNVAGSGSDEVYDTSPHNLFPLVLDALSDGRAPKVFGNDYRTEDGTCVRDYVHVADVALAHVSAANAMMEGTALEPIYNLGSGEGTSVGQIMTAVGQATGLTFQPEIHSRRLGDPDRIVADGALAARDLGWAHRHSVESMVATAWSARQANS